MLLKLDIELVTITEMGHRAAHPQQRPARGPIGDGNLGEHRLAHFPQLLHPSLLPLLSQAHLLSAHRKLSTASDAQNGLFQ